MKLLMLCVRRRRSTPRGLPRLLLALFLCSLATLAHAVDRLVPLQYSTIQDAVTAAAGGDTVIVSAGIYTGAGNRDIDLGSKNLVVRSASGIPSSCIIDCQGSGRGFYIAGGQTSATVVSGFAILNGRSNSGSGGGVYNTSGASVTYCTFTNNRGQLGGGGVANYGGGAVTHCTFVANSAPAGNGGGVDNNGGTVASCTLVGNSASNGGGGVSNAGGGTVTNCILSANTASHGGGVDNPSGGTVTSCTFSGNSAGLGGGIHNRSSSRIVNCTFTNNTASYGGGIYSDNVEYSVCNCTFTTNSASYGGAIAHDYAGGSTVLTVANCILWSDMATLFTQGPELSLADSAPFSIAVTHSIVQGGLPAGVTDAGGNLNADPLFVYPIGGDLSLQSGSPGLDAGDDASIAGVTTDLVGNPRIQGAHVDMGAYEYQSPIVVTLKAFDSKCDDEDANKCKAEVKFTLTNTGSTEVNQVTITSVTLAGIGSKDKLPEKVGKIKAGRDAEAKFKFKGLSPGSATLTLTGTSSRGNFTFTTTVTIL